MRTSKEHVRDAPPPRPSSDLRTVSVDLLPVQFTAPSINIDLGHLEPALALPQIPNGPEK